MLTALPSAPHSRPQLARSRQLPVPPRSAQRLCARCGAPTGPAGCSSAQVVQLNAAASARLSKDLPRKGGAQQRNQAAAVRTCAVRRRVGTRGRGQTGLVRAQGPH